jgi:hypothetical protein
MRSPGKYLTLVYQVDAGCKRLLWIGQERTRKTLRKFFKELGKSHMDNILSDEELAALLQLCRSDIKIGNPETSSDEILSLDDGDSSRNFFRLKKIFDATITVGKKSHHVKVSDLGLGGIYVLGDVDLPVGKRVLASIHLTNPEATILVKSYVCWQKKVDQRVIGLGIRFPMLKPDDIWLIINNIKQALLESVEMRDDILSIRPEANNFVRVQGARRTKKRSARGVREHFSATG